jgi:integrase/recombinase XerD
MKKKTIVLQSAEYKLLLQGFAEWLTILNYSGYSIPGLSGSVQVFLNYQEENNKSSLQQLTAMDANNFIATLQTKTGIRTGKLFTGSYLNKQVQALKLFSRYIRETGRSSIGFTLHRLEEKKNKPTWLTKEEVQKLYDATETPLQGMGALGIRDKAMLAVFYGCGLRLNEGASLEVNDIDSSRKVLHVRKGKHYTERFVPIAEKNFEEIKLYVDYGRPQLMQNIKHENLFTDANKGRAMHKQSLYLRIKKLVKKTGIKKKVGTHTLRHSIATHLLQSGMKLERIQQFLGHACLDNTQLYTHLANDE